MAVQIQMPFDMGVGMHQDHIVLLGGRSGGFSQVWVLFPLSVFTPTACPFSSGVARTDFAPGGTRCALHVHKIRHKSQKFPYKYNTSVKPTSVIANTWLEQKKCAWCSLAVCHCSLELNVNSNWQIGVLCRLQGGGARVPVPYSLQWQRLFQTSLARCFLFYTHFYIVGD